MNKKVLVLFLVLSLALSSFGFSAECINKAGEQVISNQSHNFKMVGKTPYMDSRPMTKGADGKWHADLKAMPYPFKAGDEILEMVGKPLTEIDIKRLSNSNAHNKFTDLNDLNEKLAKMGAMEGIEVTPTIIMQDGVPHVQLSVTMADNQLPKAEESYGDQVINPIITGGTGKAFYGDVLNYLNSFDKMPDMTKEAEVENFDKGIIAIIEKYNQANLKEFSTSDNQTGITPEMAKELARMFRPIGNLPEDRRDKWAKMNKGIVELGDEFKREREKDVDNTGKRRSKIQAIAFPILLEVSKTACDIEDEIDEDNAGECPTVEMAPEPIRLGNMPNCGPVGPVVKTYMELEVILSRTKEREALPMPPDKPKTDCPPEDLDGYTPWESSDPDSTNMASKYLEWASDLFC